MVEPEATAPPLEVAPEEQPTAAAATQQEAPAAAEGEEDHKRKLEEVEASAEANGAGEDAKRPHVEGDGVVVSQNNESSEKGEEPAAASTEGAVDVENGKVAPPIEDLQTGSEDKPAEPAMETVTEAPPQEGGTPGVPQKTSRKIDVPNDKVGVLIGKAGETIRNLQMNSGAKIQITKDADADTNAPTRSVELVGTLESTIQG